MGVQGYLEGAVSYEQGIPVVAGAVGAVGVVALLEIKDTHRPRTLR